MFLRVDEEPLWGGPKNPKGQPGTSVGVGSVGGWGCSGFVYLQSFFGGGRYSKI
jgi:hypothetical protein